ncbi:peptide/nickel transport system permease protein [Prauserella isguenensis]|uniref:Peptide/nickel transport system permease protein n=1 Tax=Prauserella isguenensis TaxID=1470180 RepID=A0A839S7M0_9PSEU|nr:ABC transporter permease [Prauserella isguenensis]MBB3053364.1 peptide/nickel transport system permease protein [Prauserella isguenensis]
MVEREVVDGSVREWRSAARTRAGTPRGGAGARARLRLGVGAGLLGVLVLAAIVVPWLWPASEQLFDYTQVRRPPSGEHVFGTDQAGRDLFVRTLAGLRVSLLVAVICAVGTITLGTVVGAVAGFLGGWPDRLLMRLLDTVNAVPHLLLGIVIVALYRGSLTAVIVSIVVTHWTTVARIVRAEVLSLRRRPFVDAAISGGATRGHILRRHILPAVAGQAALSAVLVLPHAVWHETALSFLGLGLPPHLASIGNILSDARSELLLGGWWNVAFPSVLLVLTTLATAGIAATLRDRLVPRRRSELAL